MLALPLSLDGVGEVLNIQRKKLKEGADLLRYFSMPCKPTKANGGRTRNRPWDAPEKWQRFKEYCIRDVDAEREIRQKLRNYPIPESEMELYRLDQEINDRGVMVDLVLAAQAVKCDRAFKTHTTARAYELTGLSNPNSIAQVKGWLEGRDVVVESLDKKAVKNMLPQTDGEVREMLELRLLLGKTSVKKYEAIQRSVCSDGRVHGLLQFYGANRTGSADAGSTLSAILQASVPDKYYLSPKACLGILRRASARGKELPEILRLALERQAASA
ncbi:hypothetical protein AALD01_18595 [Oscillospiraceae bacterium 21-37]